MKLSAAAPLVLLAATATVNAQIGGYPACVETDCLGFGLIVVTCGGTIGQDLTAQQLTCVCGDSLFTLFFNQCAPCLNLSPDAPAGGFTANDICPMAGSSGGTTPTPTPMPTPTPTPTPTPRPTTTRTTSVMATSTAVTTRTVTGGAGTPTPTPSPRPGGNEGSGLQGVGHCTGLDCSAGDQDTATYGTSRDGDTSGGGRVVFEGVYWAVAGLVVVSLGLL